MSLTIIGIILAVLAFGGWSAKCYELGGDQRIAAYEKKEAAAQAKVDAAQAKLDIEAKNHVDDMVTAYTAGESNARTINNTYVQRGQGDVAKYPVFSNPDCVLPDDSLRNLQRTRAGLPPTADSGHAAATVPAAGPAAGRKAGDALPAGNQGSGTMAGVHPPAGQTGGGGQVPGLGLQHPKPKPVE